VRGVVLAAVGDDRIADRVDDVARGVDRKARLSIRQRRRRRLLRAVVVGRVDLPEDLSGLLVTVRAILELREFRRKRVPRRVGRELAGGRLGDPLGADVLKPDSARTMARSVPCRFCPGPLGVI